MGPADCIGLSVNPLRRCRFCDLPSAAVGVTRVAFRYHWGIAVDIRSEYNSRFEKYVFLRNPH